MGSFLFDFGCRTGGRGGGFRVKIFIFIHSGTAIYLGYEVISSLPISLPRSRKTRPRGDQRTLRRNTFVVMRIKTCTAAGKDSGSGALDHFFFVGVYGGFEVEVEIGGWRRRKSG